jgi:imidazolonepropionase-like amidohydrolase
MRASVTRLATTLLLLAATLLAEDLAFVGVNAVTMEDAKVVMGATVIVRDGRIIEVGAGLPVPVGARKVLAEGRWLIPGLSDMHVHNWYEEEHVLFLANGVTRIRNMWGTPQHLRWQKEIESGARVGPKLFTTGPILDGPKPIWEKSRPIASPDEARKAVAEQKRLGYPALKVYSRLPRDVYRALVGAAREAGLRVVGHVPQQVGLSEALRQNQDCIEHLDGYVTWPFVFSRSTERAIDLTARGTTWNCPTLVVFQKIVSPKEAERLLARPEMQFVPPRLRATWAPGRDFRTKDLTGQQLEVLRRGDRTRRRVAKLLHDATGRLLCGTDCGNPFVVAGWSVHEELQNLVAAGLTPYEALATATTAPARFLGDGKGTIAKGERADLVLLRADPLEDIGNTRRIEGVLRHGRWYPRPELDRMLGDVKRSYAAPKHRFETMPALPEGEQAHFKVFWNDLEVGEERFSLGESIVAQQVNDPPYSTRKTVRFSIDSRGYITELEAVWEDVFGRREATVKPLAGVFYGFPVLTTWIAVERQFRGLANGESQSFDYHEFSLETGEKVTKIPVTVRRNGEREFTIWMKRADATYRSELKVDTRGWPVRFVTELQLGTVRYERVR